MERIRTVVVDDERYAREEMMYLLKQFPNIQVVGEADSGDQALIRVMELQPDLVILDVEMPKMNGVEAAKVLRELKNPPLIIFATAYRDFAADAFRIDAVDYLLKPYDEEQLHQAIKRCEEKLFSTVKMDVNASVGKLPIEQDGEIIYLPIDRVLYVSKEENVTKVVTATNEYEIRAPLKELEARLEPFSFFRIHKSHLVNLRYVTRLTPWFNGAYQLDIEGRTEQLAVSRNYVKELKSRLSL